MGLCQQTKGDHTGIWAGIYSGCYDDSGEYSSTAIVYNGKKKIGSIDLEYSHTFNFEEEHSFPHRKEPDDDDMFSIGLSSTDLETLTKIVKSLENDDEELDPAIWEEAKVQ